MKKSLFLGIFAFIFFSLNVSAQTTSKLLIGVWEFEHVELITGDATLSEADKSMKENAEQVFKKELQNKSISFSSKTCSDKLFERGDMKWKYYKDNKQLDLIREVLDGKTKLKEIKSYEATIQDGKLVIQDFSLPQYRIYLTKKP